MRVAIRMARLGTETAFEVLAKAKQLEAQGKKIIHLEIGEPDFDTPKNIKEAAKKAIDEGYTHYGPAAGLPEHRKVIAEYISATRGIPVDPDEVVVTPGAKPIIFYTILTWLRPGDEVLTPSPGFPIYESMINFVGAKPVLYPLREENNFDIDIDEFKKLVSPLTKMIILNSPHNPTGSVLSKEVLNEIARIVLEDEDILVISDEVYSEIIYEGEHYSIASIPGMKDRTVIIDGYSKTFAMTGWRCGYGVMNKELAKYVTQLQVNSTSCTATFTQIACIEALKGPKDEVKRMVAEFKKRRDVIVEGLNNIKGFSCKMPKGAFYVFPNIKGTGKTSRELQDYLLNEAGVACLSGTAFGAYGKGYLRFSYANSVENIKEALERIDKAVQKIL
ncbi:MAG: pyridoxal phosphate-dependent aminotransferase [Endomicrobia bacterium]|nr:pyridoxal phosphate-dependent aminotransferase [Endomicrobiia bacterium]MCX7941169.1 pyridoxal phosphate-dependent aminotransferase [Endomicrobiia bacterium]MDW8056201.1 pyridoxal phosphate-dependent aminotransferase [Elusimicrobiota bacterium]